MKTKFTAEQLENFWRDPANWKAGAIYFCKADPRVIVPKRNRWAGWTVNFGHSLAWPVLALTIIFVAAPLTVLALAGLVNTWLWYATLITDVAVTCLVCRSLASPKRFE